jgi:hypothetical protein
LSPNDTSIVHAVCHYTDMQLNERERLFSNLEDQNLRTVCLAVIGELDIEALQEPERSAANALARDCAARTERIRQQQVKARRENVITPFAEKLNRLYRQGKVPEKMLLIYGVSGEIPYRHPIENRNLTYEEKVSILQQRMERRFGVRWRERFVELPHWLGGERTDWVNEGF